MNTQNAINNINATESFARQAVVNGNFNIAQRGTSFTNPINGLPTVDRIFVALNPDSGTDPTSLVYSQTALTPGELSNSYYQYRLTTDGAGSGFGTNSYHLFSHQIKKGTSLLAKTAQTVTVSFQARSSIASKKIGVFLLQNYGTGGSPSAQEILVGQTYTLTSSFQTITKTFTLNTLSGKTFGTNLNDALKLDIAYQWGSTWGTAQLGDGTAESFGGSGTIDIAQLQLCSGSVALPFQPKSWEQDLLECQADYFKTFPYATAPAQNTGVTAGAIAYRVRLAAVNTDGEYCSFPVPMSATPTITYYNPSAANANWRNTTLTADSAAAASQCLGERGVLVDNPQVIDDLVGGLVAVHLTAATGF